MDGLPADKAEDVNIEMIRTERNKGYRIMFISIIVPVYNVEKYLEECLESILDQNFGAYEIICVNDGSTDHSAEILKKYEMKYSRIKVIEHAENRGLSAARNTAMKHADGKYIMFVDSDDMIVPNILEELYETAEANQLDILYYERSVLHDGVPDYRTSHRKQKAVYFDQKAVCTGRELFCRFIENKQYTAYVWRRFFRRDFLLENDLTFQEGMTYEDMMFSFLGEMKAQRVMKINKEFYIYRLRPNSIVHTNNDQFNDKAAQSLFWVLIHIFTFWNGNEFTSEENHAIATYLHALYKMYQRFRDFSTQNMEMEFGSYAEKELYRILYEKKESRWLSLSPDQIEEIKRAGNVIVYGAGNAAKEVVTALKDHNITIDLIAVEYVNNNPDHFCGIEVVDFRTLEAYTDNSVVIIGVSRKYANGIKETLSEFGFTHIITAEAIDS